MVDWTRDIQNVLDYIEAHITDELETKELAELACISPFYFQRLFSALCGMGVGEYIRCRRLSLAGEELASTHARVIDVAAKYGYDSPDSFNRAFRRFHGISPSSARKTDASLRAFAPMTIQGKMEERDMLEYKIVEKPQFTLVGLPRMFNSDTSYQEIPKFWDEVMGMESCPLLGMYGVCIDEDGKNFEYLIADNYIPWQELPAGCVTRVIPAFTWAVFPCRGPLPQTLQDVNTRIWTQWLPNCKDYRLAANLNLELYAPPAEKPEDTYSEIWLPVEKL